MATYVGNKINTEDVLQDEEFATALQDSIWEGLGRSHMHLLQRFQLMKARHPAHKYTVCLEVYKDPYDKKNLLYIYWIIRNNFC